MASRERVALASALAAEMRGSQRRRVCLACAPPAAPAPFLPFLLLASFAAAAAVASASFAAAAATRAWDHVIHSTMNAMGRVT